MCVGHSRPVVWMKLALPRPCVLIWCIYALIFKRFRSWDGKSRLLKNHMLFCPYARTKLLFCSFWSHIKELDSRNSLALYILIMWEAWFLLPSVFEGRESSIWNILTFLPRSVHLSFSLSDWLDPLLPCRSRIKFASARFFFWKWKLTEASKSPAGWFIPTAAATLTAVHTNTQRQTHTHTHTFVVDCPAHRGQHMPKAAANPSLNLPHCCKRDKEVLLPLFRNHKFSAAHQSWCM